MPDAFESEDHDGVASSPNDPERHDISGGNLLINSEHHSSREFEKKHYGHSLGIAEIHPDEMALYLDNRLERKKIPSEKLHTEASDRAASRSGSNTAAADGGVKLPTIEREKIVNMYKGLGVDQD